MSSRFPPPARLFPPRAAWFLFGALAFAGAALAADDRIDLRTPTFAAQLDRDSQTLASLSPLADRELDFLPVHAARRGDGYVQLGDLHLRLRKSGGDWRDFSSSFKRVRVKPLPANGALAAADITASLGDELPLRVTRTWVTEGRSLVLRFTLTNTAPEPVDIGVLGIPMVFDSILTDRSLEQAHAQASFVDPYIGGDGGYVQVTRLNGAGPALLVLPDGHTPLEAWTPLPQGSKSDSVFADRTKRGQTFEGYYDWTVVSRGFAEREWARAGEPWIPPRMLTLAPDESRVIGLRFVTSPTIRAIEKTLVAERRPVAVGIPGYVVAQDLDATLFLNAPQRVKSLRVSPSDSLEVTAAASTHGWLRYSVQGRRFGRARLDIEYADGDVQTVSWFVTKPATDTVAALGRFTTHEQFFDDARDPFGRAPAILAFDREANRIVTQDARVWIAGMSDEGGAGSWVAAIMKQLDNPVPDEVARLERVVNETVIGKLQVASGPHDGAVKKSLFWYDPKSFPDYYDRSLDWSTWTSWTKQQADDPGRSYNYPHVAAGYWVLYRLARFHEGLVRTHDWRWYLDRARITTLAMVRDAPYYAQFGQMEGEVFISILADLKREGLDREARDVEAAMRKRVAHWLTLSYPFGSEMPWDSTGQPEVYAWLRYFGYENAAARTREVILGYDPTVPHWGYNGNARRYWDFLYGGKLTRIERQLHHYGSTLNAVPLFDAYRANPSDLHLLRVAYGGLLGGLTNIDEQGFGAAAFHAWPDQLRFDALTGDYGMGFFGHAYGTASYLVDDPVFGWLGFGGAVTVNPDSIHIEPRDSARSRLFIAPAGAWITLAAGKIESADYLPADGRIRLKLAAADAHTKIARVAIETTVKGRAPLQVSGLTPERGYYSIELAEQPSLEFTRTH